MPFVFNGRSKLERREQELLAVGAITGRQPPEGSAALGAARIHELEHQLHDAKQTEEQLRGEVSEGKEVRRMYSGAVWDWNTHGV